MSEQESSNKPKRRVRYNGTHPRRFHEKYKELNPEKYPEELEKIKARGQTPAGSHIPICLKEILQILNPRPGEVALDATLGYGGHSQALLQELGVSGKLIALDQDPIERQKTTERLHQWLEAEHRPLEQLIVGPINFCEARSFLNQQKLGPVDMVLADLGLSSMQIDTPERGFSFKVDGPFDLRMNPEKGEPAYVHLQKMDVEEIRHILVEYSDERRAQQIAGQLVKDKPKTTLEVATSVEKAMSKMSPKIRKEEGSTPIRRVFQAFRILVNDEFSALDQFLENIPSFTKSGARIAILSFHSGEDRRVKKSFQSYFRSSVYREISPDIIRPSFSEQQQNPRSKSAKLRWAIRA
ncbi:MAG: 16S rRNA (cytosine(1402)-N(4))-methyltransferase RsmH [Bdellovibrionaceae bacterium]|nr:16S rRNA (cytosine(1402)-N(4))-methyltransferase RsmH [Pseudobdellovibrionaceae bacterium]